MSMNLSELETLEFALSMGMNPDTSEPLTADDRATIEARVAQLKGGNQNEVTSTSLGTQPEGEGGIAAQVAALAQQVAALAQGGGGGGQPQQVTFEDILAQIDPRDSNAALAMYQWLVDNKRFQRIGILDGGGYILHYQEPKGTTKAGYTPGGTTGGRMVDAAVEKAKDAGVKPAHRGLCTKCFSAVVQEDDGTVTLDDGTANTVCSAGGTHDFHG
jgi:hypothetical protein